MASIRIGIASEFNLVDSKVGIGTTNPKELVDVRGQIYSDNSIKSLTNFVTGSNKIDFHFQGVNHDRDFSIESFGDFREAFEGDSCPVDNCEGSLISTRGIEVGHVFKLGTKYSESMNAKFTDKDGKEKNYYMGCYGIGVGRVVAAAVEQNNDENGIKFPIALAPFEIVIIPTEKNEGLTLSKAKEFYNFLIESGFEVALDDRQESPGVKFKDSELLGIPFQLRIGPKSLAREVVELKNRLTGDISEFNQDDYNGIKEKLNELLG